MTGYFDNDRIPVEIPIYERAEIRPKDLAALRGQLRQAEGERDAYEAMLRALFAGLGFDPDDLGLSLESVQEVLSTLKKIG